MARPYRAVLATRFTGGLDYENAMIAFQVEKAC